MQRITIPDIMEKMILEIQAENPLLDKPIDVIKIAMTNFYNSYKNTPNTLAAPSNSSQTANNFWLQRKQKTKPKTKILSQKEIDQLSYVS
jgi:hypothetical protein